MPFDQQRKRGAISALQLLRQSFVVHAAPFSIPNTRWDAKSSPGSQKKMRVERVEGLIEVKDGVS